MAKVNFTAVRVASFKCPDGKSQAFLWDGKSPGLGLRATAAGARSYIFQAKFHSQTIRVTIGDARTWSIDEAQERARTLHIMVDSGIDPREHAAEQRAAHEVRQAEVRRQEATVGDAWSIYLKYLGSAISPKTKKPRSSRYLADHRALAAPGGTPVKRGKGKTVRGPLAPLMCLKLSDLTAERVASWLEVESAERPTNAAHAYRLLKAFIRWSAGHDDFSGIVGSDAWQSSKVTGLVPQSKAKQGGTLQREQLPAWFKAVRELDNPVASAYLQATLLCGARREEMAALKWADVDFVWKSLHLSDKVETQTGRDIPLPPYLSALLAALPRRNEWVFSSLTSEDGKIAEPRFSHNRALAAAGLPHLTIHDLRRSFGTLSEWVECPIGIVAQIQGHKPSALAEKHYRRRPLDLLRMWHARIEAWMLEQAAIEFAPPQAERGLKVVTAA
ncbi:tyrosine-type recombinase/integrase [Caballeronia sp. RCC_10]|uniref:tyrosine-type recombinase/integrase n=1 Tax=Caballeronia sp. RCC_10 TaxID=3239227 RepID=UPI0035240FD2